MDKHQCPVRPCLAHQSFQNVEGSFKSPGKVCRNLRTLLASAASIDDSWARYSFASKTSLPSLLRGAPCFVSSQLWGRPTWISAQSTDVCIALSRRLWDDLRYLLPQHGLLAGGC